MSNNHRTVTEMECIIFTGQAYKLAEKIGGYVAYLSANYADVKATDGQTHTLIGPGYADPGDKWISENRRFVRMLVK